MTTNDDELAHIVRSVANYGSAKEICFPICRGVIVVLTKFRQLFLMLNSVILIMIYN